MGAVVSVTLTHDENIPDQKNQQLEVISGWSIYSPLKALINVQALRYVASTDAE